MAMPESSRTGAASGTESAIPDVSAAVADNANAPLSEANFTLAEYKKQQDLVRSLISRRQEIERELVRALVFHVLDEGFRAS